jgi:hypothetical protein
LTKCLTGEFGKDCFGPNNTIVKYYTGAFNDMKNLLGGRWSEFENNDVVKPAKHLSTSLKMQASLWKRLSMTPKKFSAGK